jgi:hypothetical protein
MGIHAIKCTTIDWSGMAIFLGAVSAFAGTLLYGKVQQKKVENDTTKIKHGIVNLDLVDSAVDEAVQSKAKSK